MTPAIPPPVPQQLSEVRRLAGVFVSPGETFPDIVRRPRWWIPIVLLSLLSMTMITLFSQRVGWESFMRRQIEQSPRTQNLTPAQIEQAVERGARFAQIGGYVGPLVGSLLGTAIIAGILMFLVNSLMGGDIRYPSMMGIVAYAFLPNAISGILTMVVLFLKDPEDFNLQNPLMFNVGAFMPPDTARWLTGLLSSFDLFSFWIMALIAMGIHAGAPKIRFGKALGAILFSWGIYVILKTAYLAATA